MDGIAEHLRGFIDHIHSRISMLDNKCNIMMAIQAALIAAVSLAADKVFLSDPSTKVLGYLLIAGTSSLGMVIIIYLLQTIRPTKGFFRFRTGLHWMKSEGQSPGVMWLDVKTLVSQQAFAEAASALNAAEIVKNLTAARYAGYNEYLLMYTKYKAYRVAVALIKAQLLALLLFSFGSLAVILWEIAF